MKSELFTSRLDEKIIFEMKHTRIKAFRGI